MARHWTADEVLELVRGFQPACIVVAAVELDMFSALAGGARTAQSLSEQLDTDLRGTRILADALVAIGLLEKQTDRYALAGGVGDVLAQTGAEQAVSMVRHLGNCLRRWGQLAEVVRSGRPAEKDPSILGAQRDLESFIGAMDDICRRTAPKLVAELGPPRFKCMLDVGGGPGTWTIAMLRAAPRASAIIFDLPDVIELARRRIAESGLTDRVSFVAGDLNSDNLPAGADLAWVSAIVHQNSRQQNRRLFAKVFSALDGGGRVLIRDVVMDESRTNPAAGATFAVNMLTATPGGGTFTLAELTQDLGSAGFKDVTLVREDAGMNSVVAAAKPR